MTGRLSRRLTMRARTSFFALSMKKVFGSMPNKIFTIINTALVLGIGIIVISMGLNFTRYRSALFQKYDYYHQITFIRNKNSIDSVVESLKAEDYREYRLLHDLSAEATVIEGLNIEFLSLKALSVTTADKQFLLNGEKNSGFNIIGNDFSRAGDCLMLYPHAVLLAEMLGINPTDLPGKKIIISNEDRDEEYVISGIIDQDASMLMSYLENAVIVRRDDADTDKSIFCATFYYENYPTLTNVYEKYSREDAILYHYIENMKSIISYTSIFAIVFVFIGLITVFVSFGVIGSSVNMAYAEALPYLSMLKIIGIKDRKIAFFSYIDAIVLTLLGFVLAALNAYVINLLLRAFVDMGALLEDVGVEIAGVNLFAVLFCFVLCAGFGMAFYLFNYAKIRKMNINNVFLHELGEGV
jgi:hypothetical protein